MNNYEKKTKNYSKNYNHFNNLNKNVVDFILNSPSYIIIIFLLDTHLLNQLVKIFHLLNFLKFNVLSWKIHKIHHEKIHDYHFSWRKFNLIFFHMPLILNYYIKSIHSFS